MAIVSCAGRSLAGASRRKMRLRVGFRASEGLASLSPPTTAARSGVRSKATAALPGAIDALKGAGGGNRRDFLAHYYQSPENPDVADFSRFPGALRQRLHTDAEVIVSVAFTSWPPKPPRSSARQNGAGLPDLEAGCSLADACPARNAFRRLRARPDTGW